MNKKLTPPLMAILLSCVSFQTLSSDYASGMPVHSQAEEKSLRDKAQEIDTKVFKGEQPIDLRIPILEREIKNVLGYKPEQLQKILSYLTQSLINNIGGYSLGASSLVQWKTSDHLVLAHYVK
ncbi:MAG: hypothetical protein Q8L68_04825, partial [Methylococcales bacterium]|nr:hypothetical protein [Methylococcales bacterium]